MSDANRQADEEEEEDHAGNIKSAVRKIDEEEEEEWKLTPEEMRNADPVPMPDVSEEDIEDEEDEDEPDEPL